MMQSRNRDKWRQSLNSVPDAPRAVIQNAFGAAVTRESNRRNIDENQRLTFYKLPGCGRANCFAFIWQTGKEIRRYVSVEGDKSSSAYRAGDASQSKH